MYGEYWIFEGGKGGISGGGGADDQWVWGDIATPGVDYTYTCTSTLPYLGMMYDDEVDGDEYSWKILMKKTTEPDEGNFKTTGDPAVLDFTKTGGLESESEEYDNLPVPEDCFGSSELVFTSAYTSTAQWRMTELRFDGATYFIPSPCWISYDDTVRETRGDAYINGLTLGQNYPGTARSWQFYYQSNRVEESDFPGVAIPSFGGVPFGGGPPIGDTLEFFNQPYFDGVRLGKRY